MAADPDLAFRMVLPGSRTRWPCSPQFELEAPDGIALAAPARVAFGGASDTAGDAFARVIVCGAYSLPAGYLDVRQRFVDHMVVVAVDAARHQAFSGRMTVYASDDPGSGGYEDDGVSAEALAGLSLGGYFNPNLADFLALPERDADYFVYAALGGYVSNVVRIALRRHGGSVER